MSLIEFVSRCSTAFGRHVSRMRLSAKKTNSTWTNKLQLNGKCQSTVDDLFAVRSWHYKLRTEKINFYENY